MHYMRIYVYDKTFEGLLSAVFDAYTSKIFPDALHGAEDIPPLMAGSAYTVETGRDKAERVYAGLARKLSQNALDGLTYAWLSELPGSDWVIFRYIRKVFDSSVSIESKLTDPDVAEVAHAARMTNKEAHLLLGFARFQKTAQGIYFAALAPRHNVLVIMLPHFTERFADQEWALYDVNRRYGIYRTQGEYRKISVDDAHAEENLRTAGRLPEEQLADTEALFQNLWKSYFDAAAVTERINPKLQSRCMPRRYWTHMTEKQR